MADPNDDVAWNPSINSAATGANIDDRYNIPGATKIDQTVDTVNQAAGIYTKIVSFDSTFASTSTGWAQLYRVINTRIGYVNNRFTQSQTFLTPFSGANNGIYNKVSIQNHILDIRTKIDWILSFEKPTTPYTWSTDFNVPGNGSIIKGYHLAEMRKALQGKYTAYYMSETNTFKLMDMDRYLSWPLLKIASGFENAAHATVQPYTYDTDTFVMSMGAGTTIGGAGSGAAGVQWISSGNAPNDSGGGVHPYTFFGIYRILYFFGYRNYTAAIVHKQQGGTTRWYEINPYVGTSPLTLLLAYSGGQSVEMRFGCTNTSFAGSAPVATFANCHNPQLTGGWTAGPTVTTGNFTGELASGYNIAPNLWYYWQIKLPDAIENAQINYTGSFTNINANSRNDAFNNKLYY